MEEQIKKIYEKQKNDEKEIEDRFYKDLEFGTAGLRGVIGIGTNRMNKYTVTKATQGLANYIIKKNGQEIVKVGGIISPLQPGAKTQFNTSMTLDYANTYDFKIELKK